VENRGQVAPERKNLAPEVWLKRIEELRKQGKIKEAELEFRELKKHYPDYPVHNKK
jgi:hypothetical protein